MFETVIGLEVHVQLNTRTKAFCSCSTEFGNPPNSQVCPVCLGFPGSLPVLNKAALESGIKVALALNCTVQEFTKFDRKNYFYPDLPKNYQISQYDLPLSLKGYLDIKIGAGVKRIGITRVHMEEDAGKLIHKETYSLVDFNRTGVPLLEIVSEPDINSPAEAHEYLSSLKSILKYLGVSDCDMEKGSLRCDANISLRKIGDKELGTKTELKNMNSFKAVKDALGFEIKRQSELLRDNQRIIQETRLWDEAGQRTISMRTKEGAQDYRYFPDPDLTQFNIDSALIEDIRRSLPELPEEKLERFIREVGLSEADARLLTSEKDIADYFEGCLKAYANPKAIANWISGPLLAELNSRNLDIRRLNLKQEYFIGLLKLFVEGKINNLQGKEVLKEMIDSCSAPEDIVAVKGFTQISDKGQLDEIVGVVINENPKSVADYKSGKENALMFLVGQVMRKSSGKANAKAVQEIIRGRLKNV